MTPFFYHLLMQEVIIEFRKKKLYLFYSSHLFYVHDHLLYQQVVKTMTKEGRKGSNGGQDFESFKFIGGGRFH